MNVGGVGELERKGWRVRGIFLSGINKVSVRSHGLIMFSYTRFRHLCNAYMNVAKRKTVPSAGEFRLAFLVEDEFGVAVTPAVPFHHFLPVGKQEPGVKQVHRG